MKAIFLVMLSLLLGSPAFSQEKDNAGLQLTTSITRQRYCKSKDSETVSLSLSLQLIYLNTGQQRLIFYRGSNLPVYVLISLNEQNARDRKYEVNQHNGWVTSGGPNFDEESQPGDEFVVLKPGRSYQTTTNIWTPIAIEPDSQFLKPGKHVLQVVIDGWPESEKQFDRLKKRWKDTGLLWGRPIRSEPMPIEIEQQPKITRCR
jgi:hypothetical protein